MSRALRILALAGLGLLTSCGVSKNPSADEQAEYDYYAGQVPEAIKTEALHAVEKRTDWAPRKKLQFLTDRFRTYALRHPASQPAATQPATAPSSRPATRATRPATRTTTRPASAPATKPAVPRQPLAGEDNIFQREQRLLAITREYLVRNHPEWVTEMSLPHRITDEGAVWRITFTLPPEQAGGVPNIDIDKKTETVVKAWHTQ